MKKMLHFTFIGLILSSVLSANVCANKTSVIPEAKEFSFGVVPQFSARKISGIWTPILKRLSKETGHTFKLKLSTNIPAFEKSFARGDYDFAYMNPYHAVVAHDNNGYQPLLRDVGRSLYGIIVVKKDSAIKFVKELDGKKVAFPAPNALGAALLPRYELSKKFGIKVEEKYVRSHSSVYLNVALGLTAAGGGVQKTLSQQPQKIRDQLRIINKTQEVPPHPITAHKRIPLKIRGEVTRAFLGIAESTEGEALLRKVPIKAIGKSNIEDYSMLRKMGLAEFYDK